MITSQESKLITDDEGKRLKVYDDATGLPIVPGTHVEGHPTIGTGRALDTHGISDAENDFLLSNDWITIATALSIYPWWTALNPARRYVICNMCINVGVAGVCGPKGFVRMVIALKQSNFTIAAQEILKSKIAPERAGRLAAIMVSGAMLTPPIPEATSSGSSA
jgi:lysozyme